MLRYTTHIPAKNLQRCLHDSLSMSTCKSVTNCLYPLALIFQSKPQGYEVMNCANESLDRKVKEIDIILVTTIHLIDVLIKL